MGLENYAMQAGSVADLVLLKDTRNTWEAIRKQPPARTVIRKGKVISDSNYSVLRNY